MSARDAKKAVTLENRFAKWSNQQGLKLCYRRVGETDEDGYTWGFALIRLEPA